MKRAIMVLLMVNSLFISPHLFANDTVILNFKGNIKAATCDISGGSNIDIDLKRISINIFNSAQTGTEWKNFDISLNNCSSFINNIKLTFSGTADTADIASLYQNAGTAKNVAIQLQTGDGVTPLGNLKVLQIPLNGQNNTVIPLRTRAFSSAGNVVPGSVSANITATVTYL